MVTLIFSFILNVHAIVTNQNFVVAKVTPQNLEKIQNQFPNQKFSDFTNFKTFPSFKGIYIFYNPVKQLNMYLSKTYNSNTVKGLNIKPATKDSLSPVGQKIPDSYYNYQWYLETKDHILENQKYGIGKFIQSEPIQQNASLQWYAVRKKFEKAFKRKARVAVLDSGVDIRHPDLAKHIYKNMPECRYVEALDLYLPETTFTEDKDNNGYPGDCAGWNFTTLKRPRRGEELVGDNQVYDDTGHGTHISGILAAIENKIGIVGISQNIEILPVKVLKHVNSEREARLISYEGLSHWVAQGILYAVEKKVDVINLSLGWPEKVQNELVNQAIKTAFDAGVILIAGSGNDSHSESIYPCANKYVICVGASNIHGKITNFSNYGLQVDVLAPGESILSLLPQKVDTIDLESLYVFSDDMLAYMSGTSQSAPMISAISAMLKTQNKDFYEIKNLLISSSDKSSKTQAGLLSLKKLMCYLENKCKEDQRDIVIHPHATINNNQLEVNIENLSKSKKQVHLTIIDQNKNLIDQKAVSIDATSTQNIHFNYQVPVVTTEVNLSILYNGYKLDLKASIKSVEKFEREILFSQTPQFILDDWKKEYNKKNDSYLFSIKSLDTGYSTNYFFTYKVDYENHSMDIHFFKIEDDQVRYIGNYKAENVQTLFPITSVDLNFDNKNDFLIRFVAYDENQDSPYEKIIYLDQSLSKITSTFTLYPEQVFAETPDEINFYKHNDLKLPLLFKSGFVSKNSISTNNIQNIISDTEGVTQRIYIYLPDIEEPSRLEEHCLTNTEWFNDYSDSLFKLLYPNKTRPIYYQAELLLLTNDNNNKLEFISRLYNKKIQPNLDHYFFKTTIDLATFKTTNQILDIGNSQILGNKYTKMISLENKENQNFTLSTINNKKRDKLRLLHNINNVWRKQNLEAKSLSERFIAFHSSYFDSNYLYLNIETIDELIIQKYSFNDLTKPIEQYSKKKIKSTFLPPFTFEEFYLPIYVNKNGVVVPTLYNDQSELFSGKIQVLVPENKALQPNRQLSYDISESCHNMPLQFSQGVFRSIIFCPEMAEFKIKKLSID